MPDLQHGRDELHGGVADEPVLADDSAAALRPAEPKKPLYKRPVPMLVLGAIVLAVVIGGLLYWLHARNIRSTDDAFIDGYVVQISPRISGYVVELNVHDNQLVQKGDLLLEIDSRDYRAALDLAKAGEASAQAKLQQAEASKVLAITSAAAARGVVAAAEAAAKNAAQELARIEKLVPTRAATPEQRDAAIAGATSSAALLESSRARLLQAEAELPLAEAQVGVAKAGVRQAAAQLELAQINLSYTRIAAPVTGRVTHRTIERGAYLQPGQALFALVEPNVWVTANFKETELTDMRIGQPVTVTVDAYPQHTFAAHVDSFQRGTGSRFSLLPPENATGNYVKIVQRVPVKIVFDEPPDPDLMLGPGMSVEPRVRVR